MSATSTRKGAFRARSAPRRVVVAVAAAVLPLMRWLGMSVVRATWCPRNSSSGMLCIALHSTKSARLFTSRFGTRARARVCVCVCAVQRCVRWCCQPPPYRYVVFLVFDQVFPLLRLLPGFQHEHGRSLKQKERGLVGWLAGWLATSCREGSQLGLCCITGKVILFEHHTARNGARACQRVPVCQ